MSVIKRLGLLVALTITATATVSLADLNAQDVVGTYTITSPMQPGVENTVVLKADGTETLTEKAPNGSVECGGTYQFQDKEQIIYSEMTCKNGRSFSQIVQLAGLTMEQLRVGANTKARSSLFGINNPFPINIKKIK